MNTQGIAQFGCKHTIKTKIATFPAVNLPLALYSMIISPLWILYSYKNTYTRAKSLPQVSESTGCLGLSTWDIEIKIWAGTLLGLSKIL